MLQSVERIEYRRGMLAKGEAPGDLPVTVWQGAEIPRRVLDAIQNERLLDLGGIYGDQRVGDPLQYDQLRLILGDGVVEITFYNRAMALFIAGDEKLRRIHRVLRILQEESER